MVPILEGWQVYLETHKAVKSQSKEDSPPSYSSSELLFIGGVHISVRALHVLNLIYGLAKSLSPILVGRRGNFFVHVEEGGGGQHPVCKVRTEYRAPRLSHINKSNVTPDTPPSPLCTCT